MRDFHRGGFRQHDRQERKEYKAVCAECGRECTVPFEPKEGRPVYCRECYGKRG